MNMILAGEFAKEDNINNRFDEAAKELMVVWQEVDVERLERLSEAIT